MENSNQTRLLTRRQAARFLGVREATLAYWHCVGRYNLPVIKIGRLAKYKLSDLEAFIKNNQKGGEYAK